MRLHRNPSLILTICLAAIALALLSCAPSSAETAPFHIGIMTGTVSQAEDELRGAERLMQEYGDAANGGMIKHVTYPDNFMSEMETVIALIAGFADDPLMKAIIVNQAIPGTAEGFRKVKEKRPDILCFAGEAHEDPNVIAPACDFSSNTDFLSRGYLVPLEVKKLNCDTFVHISFPRHMSYESLGRRRAIMEEACKDLGVKFVFETAPDPTSDVGIAGAQQFILEKLPSWVQKYGKKTAFFCTNDALTEPLLRQVAKHGGYFVGANSLLMGYPGAFGIDLKNEAGDWAAMLKKIEGAVAKAGAAGRMDTWPYSIGYCHTVGLGEFAKMVIEKKAKITDRDALHACYAKYSPGATWNGNSYVDANTKKPLRNFYLIYEDTYVFGKGYLGLTKVTIPEKYMKIQMAK